MSSYSFAKMHALGNDFAVFYGTEADLSVISKKIKLWSDRLIGIGFDQLLFIEKHGTDVFYFHIFNADGSQASQCLNGARCVARFLVEKGYIDKREFFLENIAGRMTIIGNNFNEISLKLPNITKVFPEKIVIDNLPFTKISVGNDHLVTIVKQLHRLDIATLGKSCQAYFPNGINVGFVEILSDKELLLRTYERGAGETLCCASNTLATVVAGIQEGWLTSTVSIKFPLGFLSVYLDKQNNCFYLTGPASHCYEGKINLIDSSNKP